MDDNSLIYFGMGCGLNDEAACLAPYAGAFSPLQMIDAWHVNGEFTTALTPHRFAAKAFLNESAFHSKQTTKRRQW
jgi:hypothetical protein